MWGGWGDGGGVNEWDEWVSCVLKEVSRVNVFLITPVMYSRRQ